MCSAGGAPGRVVQLGEIILSVFVPSVTPLPAMKPVPVLQWAGGTVPLLPSVLCAYPEAVNAQYQMSVSLFFSLLVPLFAGVQNGPDHCHEVT